MTAKPAVKKIRFTEIDGDEWDTYPVGLKVYLVAVGRQVGATGYERGSKHNETWSLRYPCPRGNMQPWPEIESGWLGTTDNIVRYAWGRYEIIGQSSTHLHLREIT